jgi:hypothetical protein
MEVKLGLSHSKGRIRVEGKNGVTCGWIIRNVILGTWPNIIRTINKGRNARNAPGIFAHLAVVAQQRLYTLQYL